MQLKYLNFFNDDINSFGKNIGANKEQIKAVEEQFNVSLPDAYKEFLSLFGINSGNLLESYLMTIPNLQRHLDVVKFDLQNTEHSKRFKIESNMFFFGQWQGTVFYFICNEVNDPPVYFLQDFDNVSVYKAKFSEFIKDESMW